MTAILPVVAPGGAKAVICVSELTVNDAVTPLKVTAVAPLKTAPVMVTEVLTGPLVGVKPLIVGALLGVEANQARNDGENELRPQSAVAPGTR